MGGGGWLCSVELSCVEILRQQRPKVALALCLKTQTLIQSVVLWLWCHLCGVYPCRVQVLCIGWGVDLSWLESIGRDSLMPGIGKLVRDDSSQRLSIEDGYWGDWGRQVAIPLGAVLKRNWLLQ